jgi:hypothetical protein
MRATSVGPDLSRAIVRIERPEASTRTGLTKLLRSDGLFFEPKALYPKTFDPRYARRV